MSDSELSEIQVKGSGPHEMKKVDFLDLNAKSSLTRLLTQLSGALAESKPNREEICQLLVGVDEQKEICLTRLDKLEATYDYSGDKENALKIGDESDKVAEQTDIETRAARQFVSTLAGQSLQEEFDVSIAMEVHSATEPTEKHITASKQAHPLEKNRVYTELSDNLQQQAFEVNNSNGVQEQKVQLESIIAEQEQSTSSNNASVENTEVVQSGSSSTQSEQTTTTSNENLGREVTYGHLERIRIPSFAGDRMKYQQWNAAFSSCVDKAMLTPQLKML